MVVLSGDVGGTSTRVQLTDFKDPFCINTIKIGHYANSDYSSFSSIIDTFFVGTNFDLSTIESACFCVAGPIVNEVVHLTNLPWLIETSTIKKQLKIDKVSLINDFVAVGYGLDMLQPQDLFTLQTGKLHVGAPRAYIGAGTGLGVGFMTLQQPGIYNAYHTEGGHVDFAPTDDTQVKLLDYLRKKYHRVSFERVLSGEGLIKIYHFMRDNRVYGEEENPELRFLIDSDKDIDVAATISEYAMTHKDIIAMRALNLFLRIYGAAVGNLALTMLPFGGLYVVGGIAPKLLTQIKEGTFLEAYGDKGRMSCLIKDIPLHIVLNTDVGLQGATIFARNLTL